MSIAANLDRLHEYRQQIEATRLQMAELADSVITDEQRQEIAAIQLEFAPRLDALAGIVATIEEEVKADVITEGASVKGQYIQAVYMKGRVNYDTKALDGYSLAHPELLAFRNEGAPSVSLRVIK